MNEPRRADRPGQSKTPTSDQLLQRLALTSGVSLRLMRKFVHEMVAVIESGLLRDGVVKIHNFGTFRLSRPPTNNDAKTSRPHVIFQPTPGLRALVNQAFGPPLPFGNPISLPALIEKHLAFQSAPPEPAVEKIPPQEF
jgi:nucleoid DNA-binding protein